MNYNMQRIANISCKQSSRK